MDIKKELSKGSSALLVLSVLADADRYGYQIIKEIELRNARKRVCGLLRRHALSPASQF